MKIEVIDEKTAIDALDLVEQGQTVSYSDRWRFVRSIDDPDRLVKLLTFGLMNNCFPITVEVVD